MRALEQALAHIPCQLHTDLFCALAFPFADCSRSYCRIVPQAGTTTASLRLGSPLLSKTYGFKGDDGNGGGRGSRSQSARELTKVFNQVGLATGGTYPDHAFASLPYYQGQPFVCRFHVQMKASAYRLPHLPHQICKQPLHSILFCPCCHCRHDYRSIFCAGHEINCRYSSLKKTSLVWNKGELQRIRGNVVQQL